MNAPLNIHPSSAVRNSPWNRQPQTTTDFCLNKAVCDDGSSCFRSQAVQQSTNPILTPAVRTIPQSPALIRSVPHYSALYIFSVGSWPSEFVSDPHGQLVPGPVQRLP
jgi:hypothetical protein